MTFYFALQFFLTDYIPLMHPLHGCNASVGPVR